MADIYRKDDLSEAERGSYVMVALENFNDQEYLRLSLNDQLEYAISEILLLDPVIHAQVLGWAQAMCATIGGYGSVGEIEQYIADALSQPQEDPEDPSSKAVGTEADLVKRLGASERERYEPDATQIDLDRIRQRIDILSEFRARKSGMSQTDEPLARLFRKIYFSYKLWEALLGQVGYYNGSLELQAGLTNDFEYWMYLIQMKLRKPTRQFLFPAPKSMATYRTEPHSLLPWNNQLSFSLGFHEFGEGEMPRYAKGRIESELAAAVLDDTRWAKLLELLDWRPDKQGLAAERAKVQAFFKGKNADSLPTYVNLAKKPGLSLLTVDHILVSLRGEVKRKAFFTLVLALTWSDELLALERNAFAHVIAHGTEDERRQAREALARGDGPAIKDPRLGPAQGDEPDDPLKRLAHAEQLFNVVGRKANILVQPSTAMRAFRGKLERLTEDELKVLYENIADTRHYVSVVKVGRQAREAAERWLERALLWNKPIYTGPSGHALTYISLYARSYEAAIKQRRPPPRGAPTLDEARLVVVAGLIGRNQHHSYDETMTGAHGVTMTTADGRHELRYRDPAGYQDLLRINGDDKHPIAERIRRSAAGVAIAAIKALKALPETPKRDQQIRWVREWHKDAVGVYFSNRIKNQL